MIERRDEITPENARLLSQRVAQTLDLAFADEDPRVTIDGHDVLLELPCPSAAAVDNGLWILCEIPRGDVVVGFHTQHSHFGPWEEYSDQQARIDAILLALDEAIATAREFLAERQVVITWYSNGEAQTATCDVPEHALTAIREVTPEIFNLKSRILMLLNRHSPRFGRVTASIRSWNGTHDADIDDVRTPRTPADVLWRELEEWFREEDGISHAGPDVSFDGLEAADVDRVWQFLRSSADPIDPTQTTWDEVDNADVSVVTALERGTVAAAARCPNLLLGLTGVTAHGVKLPWLGVFIYTDAVAFYWWVSDDSGWNAETVAALARLIDDLRRLAPAAQIDVEWDVDGREFLPSIDRFLSASARAGKR